MEQWTVLFELARTTGKNQVDAAKPLTEKILSDPYHSITKQLLYIYSMECFVYHDLNAASRQKDKSKIQFYGAYAAALSYIIHFANAKRKEEKLKGGIVLYRGIKVKKDQLSEYELGSKVELTGYTSTSKDKDCAVKFALESLKED